MIGHPRFPPLFDTCSNESFIRQTCFTSRSSGSGVTRGDSFPLLDELRILGHPYGRVYGGCFCEVFSP